MHSYQPGDRVVDVGTGRRGQVVEDSITTDYPGFIPVRWDNLDRTLAHPSILEHENGAGHSAKNSTDAAATRSLKDEGTVMTIIPNTTDKATTENISHADAMALANLVGQVSDNDVDLRALANEIFLARGTAAIDSIFHELRNLPSSIEAEYTDLPHDGAEL